ncbi:hypothetical protein [Methylobacter sp.]|uniref:hypothetical protein n=1 Tax=Methylobacter sp. TaxID=2051955 RepID=UPI00120B0D97|nr:hypothetical protein [Methylobacter sp.]TAK64620.1 MAG: hypothetical protein EPO18_02455 [Methylobacter sp.]
MEFWNQFEKFNPLSGDVPIYPISHLPDIAWRARTLLKNRTVEQCISIAEYIDGLFNIYFQSVKENEINRLFAILTQSELGKCKSRDEEDEYQYALYFFDSVDNGDGCKWVFNPDREVDLDIPTAGNTSEIDTLKECVSFLDELSEATEVVTDDCKPFELFAVLALWLLSDAINLINPDSINEDVSQVFANLDEMIREMGFKTIGSNINLSMAGCEALKAMDAACYAEHLHEVERIILVHRLELTKTHDEYQNEKIKQEEEDRKRKKERSAELNRQRHKKDHEAKALVINEWLKDTNKHPSAEKAGLHFSDWLKQKSMEYEPRTVSGWIRKAANEKGIRFR